ncbi:SDR family oxidoreductase [Limnohabitans sp. T6-20]|uniref:SDR family oxidoreductase n=1 Tax=Limnohabitans sp. T6-20 TaxID=1100725 RepID=UPI000D3A68D7|nr:SDR family oxidoreductase [Limnohabitans sp. T6-20]PUE08152.1 2,4-dienoyl-CoA reductase [Limnohabitans sp. T6-20]
MTTPTPYQSVFAPGLLTGQAILVTGGGSGIGRCTAHELASLGAHVVLVGRNPDKLTVTAQEITGDGGQASWHSCDIRREGDVQAMVAQVVQQHGRIHGLVNNAGGQYISPLAHTSAKGWQAVIDTNLTGGFLVARECFNQSMQQQGGAVVNIVADMWGSMPGMGHSGAARAGMVSFTETAALEWAAQGVRVNAVAPGYIASSGMDHYPPEAGPMLREMRNTVPQGRFGTEAETSAAIVFLLSPAASFVSGTVLRVDGARPQMRMGWQQAVAQADVQERDAVKPFDGFHRAVTPKVFQ